MAETFKEIIEGEKPVLVDFFAEWCGPCKMMQPVLQQLHQKFGEVVRIIKIDVDKNPALASSLQIQGVPTLILYKKGKQVWRKSGYHNAEVLYQIIQQNL